ncbi:inositol monophosphatase family protein [Albimonas pacifica]|uniref:Inositol-1-monophosphatase n=1 Tax=Albimonas pacifica TaxID=1114924 RepID=A0A1I3IIC4_9RHOB|nr:inositol monophosphatase family protein [Albimonas pacifica]SFI47728.1 myo-inositol-1(or 4)-monophosphatase [Albimonas pacifica]
MSASGSANLNVMIKAARKAARGLLRDFGEVENLQVSRKGAADFVSRADLKAEEIIKKELMEARPAYGWLGEESDREIKGADQTRRWIVDPLDGTTNFLHGLPHWAISIALEHKGEVVAGVILDATKDEIFAAEKGAGAWLNDRRLRVSSRRDMTEMLFATGIPFAGTEGLPATLKDLSKLMPRCAGVRRFGAAALDLAWVAAGRYDGFWERGLKPWDMAAGLLMVREAGGFAESLSDPERNPFETADVVAANAEIFEKFAGLLRG